MADRWHAERGEAGRQGLDAARTRRTADAARRRRRKWDQALAPLSKFTPPKSALAERDAKIAELEREILQTAQTAEELRSEVDELWTAGKTQLVEFELKLAGARNVRDTAAARSRWDGREVRSREHGEQHRIREELPLIIDEVYKRASVSGHLASSARKVRAERGAHDQSESNAIGIVCAFRKAP